MKRNIFFIAVISAWIWACSPVTGSALYTPAPADATGTSSYDQLVAGRNLFIEKCGRCHKLKSPEKFTPAQWQKALLKMQPKAKISDAERELIQAYVLVKAKTAPAK